MWAAIGLVFVLIAIVLLISCKRRWRGWRVNRESVKLGTRMRRQNPSAFTTIKKRQW